MTKVAIIRVRGLTGVNVNIARTLDLLRLRNKNYCVIKEDSPQVRGMLNKAKDFITWGEVSDEVVKMLFEKRGEEFKGRLEDSKKKIKYTGFVEHDKKKYKPFFRLHPPRKGYGRKGIKVAFSISGALGNRGDKINELIKRMI